MKKPKSKSLWVDKVLDLAQPKSHESPFSLTVIIPTYNSSEKLYQTLLSLQNQTEKGELEVIIVDSCSTDHTFEMIQHFGALVSRFYTVETHHISEMIRRGVGLANQEYIMVLYPGSVFTVSNLFAHFQGYVETEKYPDLLYCGGIGRGQEGRELHLVSRLNQKNLREGKVPSSLNCCWFKKSFYKRFPRSTLKVKSQYTLDFFIKALKAKPNGVVIIERYFIDVASPPFQEYKGWLEICRLIAKEFGFYRAFQWLRSKKHVGFVKSMGYFLKLKLS